MAVLPVTGLNQEFAIIVCSLIEDHYNKQQLKLFGIV
jgi:hypothetical protein